MKPKKTTTTRWFSIASIFFLGTSFVIYYNEAQKNLENKKIERMFEVTKTTLDTISLYLN